MLGRGFYALMFHLPLLHNDAKDPYVYILTLTFWLTYSAVGWTCPHACLRGPLMPSLVLVICFISVGDTTLLSFIQAKTPKVTSDSFSSLTFYI